MTDDIDIVVLIDGTIRDCLSAGIQPAPIVIADCFATVLCQKQGPVKRAELFADLILLVRERVEVFAGMSDFVN